MLTLIHPSLVIHYSYGEFREAGELLGSSLSLKRFGWLLMIIQMVECPNEYIGETVMSKALRRLQPTVM